MQMTSNDKAQKKHVNIVMSTDDNYAAYLLVTLQSIIDNASNDYHYEISILDGGISEINKTHIENYNANYSNFSISLIDMSEIIANHAKSTFHTSHHISISAYYRFFIPQIFSQHDRILYLDCDLIVNSDVANLFNINMQGKVLAGVADDYYNFMTQDKKSDWEHYCQSILKMKKPANYFNSGVLLIDALKAREINFSNICMERLIELQTPKFWDQCILNSLFENEILFIDRTWNTQWHYSMRPNRKDFACYEQYLSDFKNAHILHYTSDKKPWNTIHGNSASKWWEYARRTPVYESIFLRMLKSSLAAINVHQPKHHTYKSSDRYKLRLKYTTYKVLSKITLGKTHLKFKNKSRDVKQKIKAIKSARG